VRGKVKHLRVGIHRNELHALNAYLDHPVDGVAATAAYPGDLDTGLHHLRFVSCSTRFYDCLFPWSNSFLGWLFLSSEHPFELLDEHFPQFERCDFVGVEHPFLRADEQ
jgi:hypothetical protein